VANSRILSPFSILMSVSMLASNLFGFDILLISSEGRQNYFNIK